MKYLIGKQIVRMRINEFRGILALDHPDGSSTSFCMVENCVYDSWTANIIGVYYIIGETIRNVYELRMGPVTDSKVIDETLNWGQHMGWRLFTDRGFADITFRNTGTGVGGNRWIELYEEELPDSMPLLNHDWIP